MALRREDARRLIQNSASTDAEGRFVIAPVPSGEYRLGVLNLSGQADVPHEFARATVIVRDRDVRDLRIVTQPGVTLSAVLLDGRDITDVPTEFTPRDSGRLQIVMTSRAPSFEGTVTDAAGQLARDCVVVLFGQDRTAWIPRSSMLRFAATSPHGRFSIDGLRTGRYFAVAVPRDRAPNPIDPDPQVLEALTAGAVSITLGGGERRALALKLAGTLLANH